MTIPPLSARSLRAAGFSMVGWLLATGNGWAATTVDTFTAPQATVSAGATATGSVAALGGARTLAPQGAGTAGVGGGTLNFVHGADGSGTLAVLWAGASGEKTGLGGVALSAGGDDAFLLGVTAASAPAMVALQVWSDAARVSQFDLQIAATTQPAYYRVPFALLAGGADFANVGAVGLTLRPGQASSRVQIDFLRTTKMAEAEPTARLTDVVLVDRDGDGRAGAGDSVRYLLTVTNTGATTLGNVQISAATPAHTTAAGGPSATPLARATAPSDTSAPGEAWHTPFDTAYDRTAAEGLLAAGSFLGFPAAQIATFGGGTLGGAVDANAAGNTAAVDGHQLRVNADGSLAYTPKAGFTGVFSFQYRLANPTGSSVTTARIAVGRRPAAQPDSLAFLGNLAIQPDRTQGVIVSSVGGGADTGDAIAVTGVGASAAAASDAPGSATATAAGGLVNVQTDGSFVYEPPAGFIGEDSFYYRIDNGFAQPSVAKVSLVATRRVWFLDSAVATNGDGRAATPFNSIAGFVASAGYSGAVADDIVYLFAGTGYTGAYAFPAAQTLAGQSVALADLVTIPVYSSAPAVGATPQWNAAALTLPSGKASTLRDLKLAGTAGTLVSGSGAGETTLHNLALTPTLAATGLSLTNSAGAVTVVATSINANSSGSAFTVTGGAAAHTVDAASAITQSGSGAALAIASRTGGTITLASPITATAGNGVRLTNNTGATIAFSGRLSLSTGSNAAFTATGGGTLTATHADSALTVTTGQALNIANTAIGLGDVTFRSISANGASTAIQLSSTGTAGGLKVTGSGVAGSGGIIRNTSGAAAISLTNTSGVSLRRMEITDHQGSGIAADSVTALTLQNCTIRRCAGQRLYDGTRSGLQATNLAGACEITDCDFTDSSEDQIRLMPNAGTFSLALSGGTIGCTSARPTTGGAGLVLVATGSAAATINASTVTFSNNYGSALLTSGSGTAQQTVNALSCTFTNNNSGADLAHYGNGRLIAKVEGATATGSLNTAIRAGTAPTAGGLEAELVVRNNTIGTAGVIDSGSHDGYGIALDFAGDVTARAAVTGNTIRHTDMQGFYAQSRLPATVGHTGPLDLTYRNNTCGQPDNNSLAPYSNLYGTVFEARQTRTLRLDLSGNAATGFNSGQGFRLRLRDTAAFGLSGLESMTSDTAVVAAFVVSRNPGGSTASAMIDAGSFIPAAVMLPTNN